MRVAMRSVPPRRHGVARVDREVHEHLLHLADVGDHPEHVVGQIRVEHDVLADDAPQHAVRARE